VKRLIANRPDWKRILQKRFYCSYLNTPKFTGYATLLCLDKVRDPLLAKSSDMPVCIVNDNYSWLQHFPQDEHFTLTTMFDEQGKVVQWYIDICLRHGVTENNIPWLDDLFLDVVIFPSGETKLLDFVELSSALATNELSKREYDLAVQESERLLSAISENKFALFDLCTNHRQLLLQTAQVS
jgi:uncharacterized protein